MNSLSFSKWAVILLLTSLYVWIPVSFTAQESSWWNSISIGSGVSVILVIYVILTRRSLFSKLIMVVAFPPVFACFFFTWVKYFAAQRWIGPRAEGESGCCLFFWSSWSAREGEVEGEVQRMPIDFSIKPPFDLEAGRTVVTRGYGYNVRRSSPI